MMKKRWKPIILATMLIFTCFCFAACGSNDGNNKADETPNASSTRDDRDDRDDMESGTKDRNGMDNDNMSNGGANGSNGTSMGEDIMDGVENAGDDLMDGAEDLVDDIADPEGSTNQNRTGNSDMNQ